MPAVRRIVCPHCATVNGVPADQAADKGHCETCGVRLFDGKPAVIDIENFYTHLEENDIPLLVDFSADWCAPCRVMEPVMIEAAAELEPRIRVGKVDTDEEQMLAGRNAIRGLPTLVLYYQGKEIARQSGAMHLQHLLRWVRQHVHV